MVIVVISRKMIDLLGTVTCNGNRAFTLTWLIGEGVAFSLYDTWINAYLSSELRLRVYSNPTNVAKADLAQCALPLTNSC